MPPRGNLIVNDVSQIYSNVLDRKQIRLCMFGVPPGI